MFRIVGLLALLFSVLPALAQNINPQGNNQSAQASCPSGNCINENNFAAAPSLPSVPVKGKWEVEDFKNSDASVSCSVVKYDSTLARPILHLICPGPDVFAPLRVHLSLSWKQVSEIPAIMRSMLVDVSRSVKFKSKLGESRAELTLQDPQATARATKEWITFTDVNVGLVVPPK